MKRLLAVLLVLSAVGVAEAQRFIPTYTAVSVLATSTAVVPSNTARTTLLIVNDSDTDMYCKIGAAAVVHQGFPLYANGGGRFLDYKIATGAINCIAVAAGGKVVLVEEGHQ